MAKRRDGWQVEQGGAVVYRLDGDEPRVLLVEARKTSGAWVFPKGHLEPGESNASAAIREAEEEAGVTGEVVTRLGDPLEFRSGSESVRVQYHLIRMTKEVPAAELRAIQWLGPERALHTLSHDNAKRVLRSALELIRYDNAMPRLASATPVRGTGGSFEQMLLAEYQHMADSLLRNEEDGEKRAAFFVTVTAGAGGVLAFVLGDKAVLRPDDVNALLVLTLVIVLALGWMTLTRLAHRNGASEQYKEALHRMWRFFLDGPTDPRRHFLGFDPFVPHRRPLPSWRSVGRGGWLETVAVVEALAAGALAATVAVTPSWWIDGAVGAVVAGLTWIALMQRAARTAVRGGASRGG